jgi:hypothetical protein
VFFLINLKFSSACQAHLINQNPSTKILGNSMARAAYDKCFRAILGADYQSLKLTILLSCVKTFTKGST